MQRLYLRRSDSRSQSQPDTSLLIQAVEQKGDLKIPPRRRLKGEQIAILRTWVEQGLAWAEEQQTSKKRGQYHWAFQPPRRTNAPAVRNTAWVKNPIDAFILARLEVENVEPSPEPDRMTLLRRVSLDITGLPPSPQDIEEFLRDRSADDWGGRPAAKFYNRSTDCDQI